MILPDSRRDVRPGTDWKDSRVMNHFRAQRDDTRAPSDGVVALISRSEVRRTGADTARAHAEILDAIGGTTALSRSRLCARTFGRSGCRRRDATIRRVDDERRPVVPDAIRQPRLVVVTGLRIR